MSPSRDPWPTVGRPRLTFEETIAEGNAATHCSPGGPPRNSKGGARKRQLAADIHGERPLPPSMFSGGPEHRGGVRGWRRTSVPSMCLPSPQSQTVQAGGCQETELQVR